MKKAQGISFTFIVIAILALIGAVLLIVVFGGSSKKFTNSTSEVSNDYTSNKCEAYGTLSKCRLISDCKKVGGVKIPSKKCVVGKLCCSR